MNPAYDNSVPFYPTIPNQNPVNTFFPNQMQHNGQYSRDAFAPHFQDAGYPNPSPQNVPYPASFGYNSNRSVFFPSPNQRPSVGIANTAGAPMYPGNTHNLVNPAYYPNSGPGIVCSCGNPNQNPVLANSNHVPPYSRLLHVGNFVYQLPNPHNSTPLNPSNAPWPRNQNNIYYPPATQVAGNSTNTNWNYHPYLNQNLSSYTQPPQNPNFAASHNYNAGHHAATGNNRSWIPYPNQNTFRPIPDENNDNLSEFSFDPISTPSDPNLVDSTPDLPVSNDNFALPKDPVPNAAGSFSPNPSQRASEVCGNQTDINQDSENVINNQENQTTDATNAGSSLDQPVSSDLQEELVPTSLNETSNADSNVANGDLAKFDTQDASSDQIRTDSTTTIGQSSNNISSTSVSTTNNTTAQKDTETVVESNDLGLNNDSNPSVLSGDIQNNNTENPDSNSQPKPQFEQSFDSSTAKPNYGRISPRCALDGVNFPTQISTNFRHLLIRYLNRLDNVTISTDPHNSFFNIDDDLINSFVASLNSENRRLLQQKPNNIGVGSLPKVTQNVCNENQENVRSSAKKEADQNAERNPKTDQENVSCSTKDEADKNADTELESEQNEENISNSAKHEADKNADTEPEEQKQVIVSNVGQIEADQNRGTGPEPDQCNVLLDSCADREETSVSEENFSGFQPYLSEYPSADDIDVINTNLDTIEVTVGDVCNNSIEEEFMEDVPLDLAKEKKVPERESGEKSRYFEVSQFLPKGNVYWQYVAPPVQQNTTVCAAFDNLNANDTGPHSVDVLVEVPLNLTCKNRAETAVSQREDVASNYPELSLLLTPQTLQSSLNTGTTVNGKNGIATKKKEYSLMKKAISKLLTKHPPDGSEPPKKKVCVKSADPKTLRSILKTDKPNM